MVAMVRERFVPVAVRYGEMVRKDADGDFIRKCGLQLAGAGGNLIVLTAGGKQLGGQDGINSDIVLAWREWSALPADETAPGAVKVGPRGPVDAERALPQPPEGALVLKEYYRTLSRGEKELFRHARREDFVANIGMEKLPHPRMYIDLNISDPTAYEAQPDFVWLTRDEWHSLLPAEAKPGQTFPVSAPLCNRIFHYHLVPTMAFGESNGWEGPHDVRGGKLTLTVEDVSPRRVRMRLDGFALLGPDEKTVEKLVAKKERVWGFEARLLGYVEYDPGRRVVTRFDVVALGDTYGMLQEDLRFYYRPGRHPLAASFELVDPGVPANRVPPRCATSPSLHQRYFAAPP
jgi:hypothetical protein